MKETPFLEAKAELLAQFKAVPFLRSFETDQLKRIIESSRLRIYDPGDTIIFEGDNDRWIYILMNGEVAISKKGEGLGLLKMAGELFGELAVLGCEKRSATARAMTAASCLAIDATFMEGCAENQRSSFYAIIYRLLAETLGGRLVLANQEITRLKGEVDMLKSVHFTHG